MRLNDIKSAAGSRQESKKVGRGIGCSLGKTCGKGHKGQKARAGGFRKVGFEGGQMPIQRRLPKIGFNSIAKKIKAEVTLDNLRKVPFEKIDIGILKELNIIHSRASHVKLIGTGDVTSSYIVQGIKVTKSAINKIEAFGGKIEV